jgi:hypothetical protein
VATVKVCQGQLYGLYINPNTCYISKTFKDFKDVLDCKHGIVSLMPITSELDLNTPRVEYMAFQCAKHIFYVIYLDHLTGRLGHVNLDIYNNIMEELK